MQGVLLATDVRKLIIDRLTDATYGVNNILTTIDTERSTSTPSAISIDPPSDEGNYPSIYVDFGDSDIEENLGADLVVMREVIQLQVMAILKHGDVYVIRSWGENYIEAILRSLQNYVYENTSGNFACLAIKCIRADLDTEQEQTTRGVAVVFNVHRNKLQ